MCSLKLLNGMFAFDAVLDSICDHLLDRLLAAPRELR